MLDGGTPNVEELEARGDVVGLVAALDHQDDWKIPIEACKALGRIGGEKAVDGLITALHHPDRSVREKAVDALGEIGDAIALDALAGVARDDPSEAVRWLAASAVGRIGGSQAVEVLIALIKLPNYTPHQGVAAGLVYAGAAAVEPLIAALEGPLGLRAREKAIEALEKLGSSRGAEWLAAQAAQPAGGDARQGEGMLEFISLSNWDKGVGQGAESFQAALDHWNAKRYDEALASYQVALQAGLTSPYEAAARSNSGKIYLKQENVEAAIGEFHKGLALPFMTASTAYSLAVHLALIYEVLGKQQDMQEAVAVSREALKRIDTIMSREAAEEVRATVRRVYG